MKKANLRIDDIELKTPFLLAPLAGITDQAMRSLCCEAGASLTYTEMVSAKGLWYGDRKTSDLLAIADEEGPVAYQLFGSEPIVLAHAIYELTEVEDRNLAQAPGEAQPSGGAQASEAAQIPGGPQASGAAQIPSGAQASGAAQIPGPPPKPWPGYPTERRPVLFDLNAGCPVPKIVKNGEGSALLRDPDLLHDCVRAMSDAAREAAEKTGVIRPVTVKIRKGFSRDEDLAVECAKAIEAAGAAAVTVHGRCREQYYEGRADWDCIARVKDAVAIPVIGNGDVMSGGDALRMMEETGCDGVMIARGALGNPWIFEESCCLWEGGNFRGADEQERIETLVRHLDLVCRYKGEDVAVREMRKHVGWYIRGIHGATRVRKKVNEIDDVDALKQTVRSLL